MSWILHQHLGLNTGKADVMKHIVVYTYRAVSCVRVNCAAITVRGTDKDR